MAIGNTNSGSKASSNDIKITYTTEVSFLDGYFPIMLGDKEGSPIPGTYDEIVISASPGVQENFVSYNGNNTYNSYYYDLMRWWNYAHENNMKTLTMEPYTASNPVLVKPCLFKFTDNDNNVRWGWRSVSFTNSTSGDFNTPHYRDLVVTVYKYLINTSGTSYNKKYVIHLHFKVLTYDTVNNEYKVTPYDYDFTSTSSGSFNTNYGYSAYGRLTIPYTHILCGISDITAEYYMVN